MIIKLLKKIYYARCFSTIVYPITVVRGKQAAHKLKFSKDNTYMVCSHGIGDVVWMAAYFQGFSDANSLQNIVFICDTNHCGILQQFYPDTACIGLTRKKLILLGWYADSGICENNLSAVIFPRLKRAKVMDRELSLFSRIGLEMDICYKFGCFSLPYQTKITLPQSLVNEVRIEQILKDYGISEGKTVVLVPYVNSRLNIPIKLWKELAAKIAQKGIMVYVNMPKEDMGNSPYIRSLALSLDEIPSIVKRAGCVITGRCGLADWLFLNECNMVVLHSYMSNAKTEREKTQSRFGRAESFREMQHRCGLVQKLDEFRVDISKQDDKLLDEIAASAMAILSQEGSMQ